MIDFTVENGLFAKRKMAYVGKELVVSLKDVNVLVKELKSEIGKLPNRDEHLRISGVPNLRVGVLDGGSVTKFSVLKIVDRLFGFKEGRVGLDCLKSFDEDEDEESEETKKRSFDGYLKGTKLEIYK